MVLAAGCGESAPPPPTTSSGSGSLLIGTPAAGYTQTLDVTLTLQAASRATSAAEGPTLQALRTGGFGGGEERVWTKGDEYITALVVQLSTTVDAANFVQFERLALKQSTAVVEFTYPAIPDSASYSLYGQTRQGSRQTFCQGIWFPVSRYAFELTDCASALRYANLVEQLAQEQYSRATAQT